MSEESTPPVKPATSPATEAPATTPQQPIGPYIAEKGYPVNQPGRPRLKTT